MARSNPFTTLGKCKDNGFRVTRRLNTVLGEIGGDPAKAWLELPSRSTVDRAYLRFEDLTKHVQLEVYPADTLAQARVFYTRPGAASSVLSLRAAGWDAAPNFHFGYMAKGLVWTTVNAGLEEYVAYWRERIEGTRAISRDKWEDFWSDLIERRFASADDKAEFDQSFTNTGRESAAPRPGRRCFYSWKLSEAKLLDDRNRLVATVADQLNVVLRALGEKPHESLKI